MPLRFCFSTTSILAAKRIEIWYHRIVQSDPRNGLYLFLLSSFDSRKMRWNWGRIKLIGITNFSHMPTNSMHDSRHSKFYNLLQFSSNYCRQLNNFSIFILYKQFTANFTDDTCIRNSHWNFSYSNSFDYNWNQYFNDFSVRILCICNCFWLNFGC